MNAVTVRLNKPIAAHGEEVTELALREPVTKEVIEIGQPMLIIVGDEGKSTGIEIRQRVVAKWISKLAAIPMSSVEALSLGDYSRCTAVVMGFFGGGDGEELSLIHI
jgi:hypothetical protein